jgi:6-phosphogluconate dehydrogenase
MELGMIVVGRMGTNMVQRLAALYERFSSRGEDSFADKILSALQFRFGGHHEKAAGQNEGV